jgi:FKBP-type peptidyl-prolyl cis-trans isomerase 2
MRFGAVVGFSRFPPGRLALAGLQRGRFGDHRGRGADALAAVIRQRHEGKNERNGQGHSLLTLHYRLATADDTELVSTFGAKPATLQLGSGELAPVLERLPDRTSMSASATVFLLERIRPSARHNPQLMQRFARSELPPNPTPNCATGLIEFAAPNGAAFTGLVRELTEEAVLIDFNHPLAGKAGPLRGRNHRDTVMDIILANPRGFCAGVERAIEIVERALERFGAPIYVRHEVVHNKYVVDGLRAKGAVFVEELDEVPDGATVIFSAHGVPQAVRRRPNGAGCASSTPPVRW